MKGSLTVFVGRRVWGSLRDLGWSHALISGTMATALFIFGAFLLAQENLQHLLKGWGEQIQMYAYLEKGLAAAAARSLAERVRSFPEVEHVRYISREQAWNDFRAALGPQAGVLDGLPADVLPSSLEIRLKAAHRDDPVVAQLADRLRQEKGIALVEYPQEWVERLSLIVLAVQWAKWSLGGVLFMATFFIVGSTVRLAVLARKDEIEIMQLVGASEKLIQAPFIVEGLIQGTVGGAIAVVSLWGVFVLLRGQMTASVALFGPLGQLQFLDPIGIGLLFALGCFLGASGSLFSLRRFLKTWRG